MPKEVPRCVGACCHMFPLSVGFDELGKLAEQEKAGQPTTFGMGEVSNVADMLISLGRVRHNPITGNSYEKPTEVYTCRHFDAGSGNCLNYENRPRMCRDHAMSIDRICNVPDCPVYPVVVENEKERIKNAPLLVLDKPLDVK